MPTSRYRGRFAPSPTGPLHFGSLVAALGSFLDARSQNGEWLLRIEDIDTPRNVPGAAEAILRCLEEHAFTWDGPVIWQSRRLANYKAALADLVARQLAYPCACTRSAIAREGRRPALDGGLCYPGTCRNGLPGGKPARAWRFRVDNTAVSFVDRIQGEVTQHLEDDVGDFVLQRADGLFAYQLAVTVDDGEQGISDIVRGADLLASTPRQIALQRALGLPTPTYAHLPLAVNGAGEKLSKQTLAPAIDAASAAGNLWRALDFLGQTPDRTLATETPETILTWAIGNWRPETIPKRVGTAAG